MWFLGNTMIRTAGKVLAKRGSGRPGAERRPLGLDIGARLRARDGRAQLPEVLVGIVLLVFEVDARHAVRVIHLELARGIARQGPDHIGAAHADVLVTEPGDEVVPESLAP